MPENVVEQTLLRPRSCRQRRECSVNSSQTQTRDYSSRTRFFSLLRQLHRTQTTQDTPPSSLVLLLLTEPGFVFFFSIVFFFLLLLLVWQVHSTVAEATRPERERQTTS